MKFCKLLYLLLSLFFCHDIAAAEQNTFWENEKISIRAYSQYIQTQANKPFLVLIEMKLKNGWHISWDNPGDAGTPVSFEWKMPQGYLAQPITKSIPEKFLYEDILTQYGYGKNAYYLFEIFPSAESSNKDIKLTINWTACRDSCEPKSVVLNILLPENGNKNLENPAWQQIYLKASKTFPKKTHAIFDAQINNHILELTIQNLPEDVSYANALFIPFQRDIISASEPQKISYNNKILTIHVEAESEMLPSKGGLLVLSDSLAYEIFDKTTSSPINNTLQPFIGVLLMAFVAGILLNLMPCVFPVLTLKALSLSKNIHKKNHVFNGLAYMAGVVCCFVLIAAILYELRSQGELVGWGFQLQSPWFVGIMLAIFTIIGLMMLNIISLKGRFATTLTKISSINPFLTGFFAVLIASPCTGPFMGAIIGYALMQPSYIYFPAFLSLGLGYAFPFTLIEIFPSFIIKILPKPGAWMNIVKQLLAIPVILTCFWLTWVLYHQVKNDVTQTAHWHNYNHEQIERLTTEGSPVFIAFTAKWCITCLFNEQRVLETKGFEDFATKQGISLFKADWTNHNPEIFSKLQNYGRGSIPLYVFYPKNSRGKYIILPQLLTSEIIEQSLNGQNQNDN